jgi:LysM repeat protein
MNRNVAIILALALAVGGVLSGCNRPMSTGPLPKPVTGGTVLPTTEPMSQVTPQAQLPAVATATPQAAAPAGGAAAPVVILPTAQVAQATPVPTEQPAAAAVSGAATTHTVKPGEWLFSIGRQYNVSPFTLAQVNRIGPPYRIYPGQVLTIPGGQAPSPGTCSSPYTVRAGDTVYSIGRLCGKTPAAIISANNLANPNFLLVGQQLQIP